MSRDDYDDDYEPRRPRRRYDRHDRYDYANKTNPGGTFARAFGGTSGVILAIIGIPLLLTFFLCAGCVGCTVLASKVPPPKEEPTFVPVKDNPVNDQKVEPKRQR
jgi:hypothetical protein